MSKIDSRTTDGYSNDNGLGLSQADATAFMKRMANEAHALGMSIGLKNAEEIIPTVQDDIEFAVNEECTKTGKCGLYLPLLNSGKPVFHIEYGTAADAPTFCLGSLPQGNQYDTVIKNLSLDGWVAYCDGTQYRTPTTDSPGS